MSARRQAGGLSTTKRARYASRNAGRIMVTLAALTGLALTLGCCHELLSYAPVRAGDGGSGGLADVSLDWSWADHAHLDAGPDADAGQVLRPPDAGERCLTDPTSWICLEPYLGRCLAACGSYSVNCEGATCVCASTAVGLGSRYCAGVSIGSSAVCASSESCQQAVALGCCSKL